MTYLEHYIKMMKDAECEDIILSDYAIGYIDLLGITLGINSNQDLVANSLNRFYSLLNVYKKDLPIFSNILMKAFSDNIIIAQEIKDCSAKIAIDNIITICSLIQLDALLKFKTLLRGGVTTGNLFVNNNFVIGDGLVNAYKLEDKFAIYPRIIIDKKIEADIDILRTNPYGIKNLLSDMDGMLFINYTSGLNKMSIMETLNLYISFYNSLINQENNLKIIQKYHWQVNYLERVHKIAKDILC